MSRATHTGHMQPQPRLQRTVPKLHYAWVALEIRPFLSDLAQSALSSVLMQSRGTRQLTKRAENRLKQCVHMARGQPNTPLSSAGWSKGHAVEVMWNLFASASARASEFRSRSNTVVPLLHAEQLHIPSVTLCKDVHCGTDALFFS